MIWYCINCEEYWQDEEAVVDWRYIDLLVIKNKKKRLCPSCDLKPAKEVSGQ